MRTKTAFNVWTVLFLALIGAMAARYYIWGVAENVGGTTTVWATTMVLQEDDATWDAQAVADDGVDALVMQVMGNGEIIRWVATVRTTEVAW